MSTLITSKLQPYAIFDEKTQLHVAENSKPLNLDAGQTVFNRDEQATSIYYLLKGKVELEHQDGKRQSRGASALNISGNGKTYSNTCRTLEKSVILQIKQTPLELDELMCQELIKQFHGKQAWVESVMESGMFNHIPSVNMLRLIQHFEEEDVNAGDVLTHENQYEKRFFVLMSGTADVFQGKLDENSKALSQVQAGQTFGEAALLDDLPRTATIRMAESGKVMVLDTHLLETLERETIDKALLLDKQGIKQALGEGYQLLDIRPEKEASLSPIKGAVLAPMDKTPDSLGSLSNNDGFVIYSPYLKLNKMVYQQLAPDNSRLLIYKP